MPKKASSPSDPNCLPCVWRAPLVKHFLLKFILRSGRKTILLIIQLLTFPTSTLPFLACSLQLASAAGILSSSSPPIFIFGASLVDAGQNAIAMPRRSYAEVNPYGSDYFGKPVGRWSNGRTFMDFITEGLGYANSTAVDNDSGGLFCLLVQVDQFRDFHDIVMSSYHGLEHKSSIMRQFSEAVYFFQTGDLDYVYEAVKQSDTSFDLNTTVTTTIMAMKTAFQMMYVLGARTFIIMNVSPIGCCPGLVMVTKDADEELDENNCSAIWTNVVQTHNKRLSELLDELRDNYPRAEWVLFDAYSIFLDGYLNPSKYGILYPFKVCCGAGGAYNFNVKVLCGMDAQYINGTLVAWTKCDNPKHYLIWDTLHPVESFAYHIAQGVLSGTYLVPSFSLKERVQSSKVFQEMRK
ncbi:hypothetical protein GOP47_0028076 [Adiantum capillus-veneris]|nr:hypothetical protein GOP47_0028076 [Adiantum capillus-veneris]